MALGESLLTEDPLFGLDVALDDVGAIPLSSLGPAALGLRAVALQRARNRLDAITAETLAEAENARTSVVAGQRNMSQYVAARTHCEPSAIRRDTRLGRWLWSFPELAEAFRSGVLSRRHLEDIQSVDNVRTHFMLKRDQHLFIGFVEELEWKSFKHAVKYWLDANDPDGKEPKEKVANNTCTLRTLVDGTVELKATLDPVSGAVVKNAIEAEDQRLFRRDEDNDVVRRVSHRRAEALTIVAALAMGNTAGGTPQPLVHLVMSEKVAEDTLARLNEPSSEPLPLNYDDVDGRCELIDGTPVHPRLALVLLATAKLRRQVLAGKSRTLDLGTTTPLFPKWMKEAVLVEARGQCAAAGCDAPFAWMHADHREPRSKGGRTSMENIDPLCDPDNKFKRDRSPLPEKKSSRRWNPEIVPDVQDS